MGIIELHNELKTATLYANLIFYGQAATEQLSNQIATDINQQYNAAKALITIHGNIYTFVMQVAGIHNPSLQQIDVIENDNPLQNYFRIEEYASGNISFVDGVHSNTGYFMLANILHNSTTAAHEFGHTIGLEHPQQLDIRGYGIPGIMHPRGTICNPEYQYDLHAAPHAPGGTMNPNFRQVQQQNITDLQIDKLKFNTQHRAIIGAFSSQWHYAHSKE